MLQESFSSFFLNKRIESLKNMPFKIWLPWKRQVTWTATCHIKLLPDKFWKKSPSLVAFTLILKTLLTPKVAAGRIRPPPPPPPPTGLNRVKLNLSYVVDVTAANVRLYLCFPGRLLTYCQPGRSKSTCQQYAYLIFADLVSHYI